MRIEVANLLHHMLDHQLEAFTVNRLIDDMNLARSNVVKRVTQMYADKLLARELRYVPTLVGRNRILHFWVTDTGVKELAEYDARRAKRPTVSEAKPMKKIKFKHVPNSVFDIARGMK